MLDLNDFQWEVKKFWDKMSKLGIHYHSFLPVFDGDANCFCNSCFGHGWKKKKKPCYTGGRTCQVGSVCCCWVFFFFFFFFFSKNDPKNMKISKKNQTFFAEKFWENILTYFQKFAAKIFRFWWKNGWFYKILEKLKTENLPKRKIWVCRACKTFFFFFFFSWPYIFMCTWLK